MFEGTINQDIRVEIGYKEFYFTDVMRAVSFARAACKSIEDKYKDTEIRVVVDFKRGSEDSSDTFTDEEDD